MEKTVIANLEYDLSYKDRPMTFSEANTKESSTLY